MKRGDAERPADPPAPDGMSRGAFLGARVAGGATAVTPRLAADETAAAAAFVNAPENQDAGAAARRTKVAMVSPGATVNGAPSASTRPLSFTSSTT